MRANMKDRMRYRFERFLAKGGMSIFVSLTLVFLATFVFLILVRGLIVLIWPDYQHSDYDYLNNFLGHIWAIWLQMTDPGNMNQDNHSSGWVKVSTILAGTSGVIILSMLIAFITTQLEKTLYEFRKGRGPVLEEDMTLILGWNERVVDIIRELIIANESEKHASVVILAEADKETMDDMLIKRLPDTKTTKIITTTGDPANVNELKRVRAYDAKSVIVLASCSDSAPQEEKILSDTQSVKTIMALIACQGGENELPIVAEIFEQDKRDLIEYFEDENIISLDSWDIMGKLLVQTSLTSGLEMVYNEILSFDGSEIYFYDAKWKGINFYELPFHFEDGIPLGVYHGDHSLTLRPPDDYTMKDDDQILILAEDDSTIDFQSRKLYTARDLPYEYHEQHKQKKRVLILGWHHVGTIFIRESDDYLEEGSEFDIMFEEPSPEIRAEIERLQNEHTNLVINLIEENPLDMELLNAKEPYNYNNVIILSQDAYEQSAEKIDSDTLMILLLLRRIALDQGHFGDRPTKIITQVLNSDNQDLIIQTDVDDFIISNKLITMILAQLSEQPAIKKLYDDIFEEDGSEIYVKPAHLYFTEFPIEISFADAIATAHKRDEICLGVRFGELSMEPKQNFGVELNLPKDKKITITEKDFLVVLAEDEL